MYIGVTVNDTHPPIFRDNIVVLLTTPLDIVEKKVLYNRAIVGVHLLQTDIYWMNNIDCYIRVCPISHITQYTAKVFFFRK